MNDYFVMSFLDSNSVRQYCFPRFVLKNHHEMYYDEFLSPEKFCDYRTLLLLVNCWYKDDVLNPDDNFDLDHLIINKVDFQLKPVNFSFTTE